MSAEDPKPSICRSVIYRPLNHPTEVGEGKPGPRDYPAVITHVDEDTGNVDLCVFGVPGGCENRHNVPHLADASDATGAGWRWPERV